MIQEKRSCAQIQAKMVKVIENGQEFYLDGYMKSNLDIVKKQINEADMDFVGIVDGFEGVGKSVCAMQVGYYVDPTLDIDRICFTADEFKEAVLKAKKGQCIIYDEAITGAFSREAIQQMNVVLIKMMAQIRQKNLFMLLVLPSYFDLDKNLAIWRAKFLIHCHYGDKFQRGFFKFANLEKKKGIYIEGQKLYRYPKEDYKWNFRGRFTKYYPIDEAVYRKKKSKSLVESDYESVSIRKVRSQRDSLIVLLHNFGFTQTDISEFSDLFDEGVTQKQVSNVLRKYAKVELRSQNSDYKLKDFVGRWESQRSEEKGENDKKQEEKP